MMNAKLDALGFGWIGSTVSLVFLAILIGLIALVVWRIRRKDYLGAGFAAVVLAAAGYSPVMEVVAHLKFKHRYDTAKAIFDEKCKTAGERIYKTVDNVEGVLLSQIRPKHGSESESTSNPMWPDAAFAREHTGDDYIKSFLLDRGWRPRGGPGTELRRDFFESVGAQGERGFAYVEQIDSVTGTRSRVTAQLVVRGPYNRRVELIRSNSTGAPPRYAITIENNVDPALRKLWVAGSTVRVIDTTTNTTLGELEVWRFDRSQGNTNQSMPWLTSAAACPEPKLGEHESQTHYFVARVLKVKQGN